MPFIQKLIKFSFSNLKCLDAFTKQQSRLVGIVDALDSCDTERIITVLSSVQTLLSAPNRPFVMLLAVDPHVIVCGTLSLTSFSTFY